MIYGPLNKVIRYLGTLTYNDLYLLSSKYTFLVGYATERWTIWSTHPSRML